MKKLLSLLAITFITINVYAQDQHLIDSLLTCLKIEKEDTTRANILYALSKAYLNNNPDQAMDYANQTQALSEKIDFKKGFCNAYSVMGAISMNKGDYLSALVLFKKSLKISEETGYKRSIANSYGNIGGIYIYLGNYPEALKIYLATLKMDEKEGDKHGMAVCYSNIGIIYTYQDNYPEALQNYQAALKIYEETGDKQGIAASYSEIGGVYVYQGNYSEALKNDLISLKIKEEIGDKYGIAASYNNIAGIYHSQGNYPEALKNYFAALKIREGIGDKRGIALTCCNIGQSYYRLKKFDEASQYMNRGLSLGKEIGSLESIKDNYEHLATLDSARGNYKSALEHFKLYISTRDSLVNRENTKKITQQQMQYDFDKKEALAIAEQEKKDALAKKELQKQKLVRNGFIGGFAVVLLFAGVFFTQRNKIKKGKKLSDELLLNILPAEVAEELKAKGSAEAKLIDDVTVLFTDFKGFTQLSEKLSPKDLVAEINECFSAFDYIMQKYGVEKIKTIGDSYMAAGGLPTPNYTHASDVVKAALDIQHYMKDHKARKEAAGELFFEIRIGVHTGPVVAGIVGVKKFAYDIWGDTVNTASRMESSGESDRVNISGTTYELVKDDYTCIHRGKVQAKGKGMIDMYFVEAK